MEYHIGASCLGSARNGRRDAKTGRTVLHFTGEDVRGMIDRSQSMTTLATRFPEVVGAIDKYEAGILHCKVAAFRRVAEQAMDQGRFWDVERYFRFVEETLPSADAEVRIAIEISFVEDFALGEHTEQRHRAVRERVSKVLREKIAMINEKWR
jgi:hypothetical protein